jgi:hypothetical protein
MASTSYEQNLYQLNGGMSTDNRIIFNPRPAADMVRKPVSAGMLEKVVNNAALGRHKKEAIIALVSSATARRLQ